MAGIRELQKCRLKTVFIYQANFSRKRKMKNLGIILLHVLSLKFLKLYILQRHQQVRIRRGQEK